MMAFFWQRALLFSLAAAFSVHADMKLDCQADFVYVVWTDSSAQTDPSLLRLGNCFPTSLTATEAVFNVGLNDCYFMRLFSGGRLVYSNNLTYIPSADSRIQPFTLPVVCEYDSLEKWFWLSYIPVFQTYGLGALVFHIGLMNEDFSGPAESAAFPLGSIIRIMASVEQESHQPLLLLLEECEATNTAELSPESRVHPIITNKGCLVEGKFSRSKFEPRQKSSEIQLSLQAFRFAQGEEIFLHCKLVAWDPQRLDNTKKACNYDRERGWELLDNLASNQLCNCCESSCSTRRTRSAVSGKHGAQKAVLGPLTITDVNS